MVSPRGSAGWPPTTVGVNFGSLYRVAKLSRSAWSKPSNAKITMVWPLPVKPVRGELAHVVGVAQRAGLQPLIRHVQRQHRRLRRVMRGVAQDPAEFDNLRPHLLGHRRLLRGRVEQLTPLAAVVVHLNAECGADLFGIALDDGPVVAGPPSHRKALAACPAHQPLRRSRVAQGDGQLGVIAVRGPEIG